MYEENCRLEKKDFKAKEARWRKDNFIDGKEVAVFCKVCEELLCRVTVRGSFLLGRAYACHNEKCPRHFILVTGGVIKILCVEYPDGTRIFKRNTRLTYDKKDVV